MANYANSVAIDREKFEDVMNKRGFTNAKLAAMMGIDKTTISNWKTGATKTSPQKYKQLCAILDIEEDEIKKVEPKVEPESIKGIQSAPGAPVERLNKGPSGSFNYIPPEASEVTLSILSRYMDEMHNLIETERKANDELRDLLRETIGLLKTKESVDVMEMGAISMELCDYSFRQFKKKATEKANEVISKKAKYKTTNEVFSDVYKLLRAEYGVVWEQEKKEFVEVNGYQPASTLQLCYWIEANKPAYHNLFMSKMDTLAK